MSSGLTLTDLHDHKGHIRSSKDITLLDLPLELLSKIFRPLFQTSKRGFPFLDDDHIYDGSYFPYPYYFEKYSGSTDVPCFCDISIKEMHIDNVEMYYKLKLTSKKFGQLARQFITGISFQEYSDPDWSLLNTDFNSLTELYCFFEVDFVWTDDCIKKLSCLKILWLGGHSVEITDEGLRHVTNLEVLNLEWNGLITDAGLKHLPKLRYLMCNYGKFTDEGIQQLQELEVLHSHRNKTITMKGLCNLQKIRAVYLDDNENFNTLSTDTIRQILPSVKVFRAGRYADDGIYGRDNIHCHINICPNDSTYHAPEKSWYDGLMCWPGSLPHEIEVWNWPPL